MKLTLPQLCPITSGVLPIVKKVDHHHCYFVRSKGNAKCGGIDQMRGGWDLGVVKG